VIADETAPRVTDVDEAENVTDGSLDEVTGNDEATAETEAKSESQPRDGIVRRSAKVTWTRLGVILLAVVLVASAGVAMWLYFKQYRPDQETNATASAVALDAAKNGTISLLSYSPEKLDKDFANAKSHLTGDFLSYYTEFTEQVVTPAAKQKSVKTSANVVRAAVSEMHPDSAVVLVFINQITTSKENPDGAFAASAVKVGLKKISDAWLISSFDPV
jgi:Mce-associated membrane protein